MKPETMAVLNELEARDEAEARIRRPLPQLDREKLAENHLLSVGRGLGSVLNLLIKDAGCKSVLEVGTSFGYSTIWLADAVAQNGGRVFSLELHGYKQEQAKSHISKAGLAEYVQFIEGDARKTISSIHAQFDFVLIDAWKDIYIDCFDLTYPRMNDGGIIVADNMLRPSEAIEVGVQYRNHVRGRKNVESVLLPIDSGIYLSRIGIR